MAELKNRRLVVRADASVRIGAGHVMRCLTLAAELRSRGAQVQFVCRDHEGNLGHVIEEQGFALRRLAAPGPLDATAPPSTWLGVPWEVDAEETRAAMGGDADWLIVDHYAIDARWEGSLRR